MGAPHHDDHEDNYDVDLDDEHDFIISDKDQNDDNVNYDPPRPTRIYKDHGCGDDDDHVYHDHSRNKDEEEDHESETKWEQ